MPIEPFDIEALRQRDGIKWRRYGDDVIPAWVADMDLPIATPIRDYLVARCEQGDVGYPGKDGEDSLCEVFAERVQRRCGWSFDPTQAEVITDVVQGLYLGLMATTEEREGAIVQTPIYPPFLSSVADTGRRLVLNPLISGEQGFQIDFDHLASVLGPNVRVFMLCNPHNPSGRAFTRQELEGIADTVLRHDLYVLADEIHSDLLFDGRRHIPFASLDPALAARTITFNAATKSFNTAGLRCAVVVFGSEELRSRFNRVPKRVRGGLSAFATAVSRIAWEEGDPWLHDAMAYLHENRRLVTKFVAESMPEVGFRPPEATYLAWLDCRPLGLNRSPFEFFLEHARVALMEGGMFGDDWGGWVRLNFATSRTVLETMLERMEHALGPLRA